MALGRILKRSVPKKRKDVIVYPVFKDRKPAGGSLSGIVRKTFKRKKK